MAANIEPLGHNTVECVTASFPLSPLGSLHAISDYCWKGASGAVLFM